MKDDLDLRYRRVRRIQTQANSERCLVLRQQYAMKISSVLSAKKVVVNVDESWLSETNFLSR